MEIYLTNTRETIMNMMTQQKQLFCGENLVFEFKFSRQKDFQLIRISISDHQIFKTYFFKSFFLKWTFLHFVFVTIIYKNILIACKCKKKWMESGWRWRRNKHFIYKLVWFFAHLIFVAPVTRHCPVVSAGLSRITARIVEMAAPATTHLDS